jgi:hypothetical protein
MSVHKTEHLVSCGPRFLAGWQLKLALACVSRAPPAHIVVASAPIDGKSPSSISNQRILHANNIRWKVSLAVPRRAHKIAIRRTACKKIQGPNPAVKRVCALQVRQCAIYSGQGRRHCKDKEQMRKHCSRQRNLSPQRPSLALVCVPCINFARWMRLEAK